MSEQIETKSQEKSWLNRLKEESWEAELLVSAVAIFAILKSFGAIDWLVIEFIDNLDPSQYLIGYAVVVCGYLAVGVLACMFIIHFALRAYWIGLVGLNSVFPDYSLKDSVYSSIYTEKLLQILPKLPKTIAKVDELCSVIFSAAFSLMMIYLYFTLVATLYLIIFNLLKDLVPYWILLIPAYIIGLIFIIGVLISIPANMKRNHQKKRLQHVFFVYSSFGNKLLYGPLYKNIMQIFMIFGSNFKRKKSLVRLVIVMSLAGVCFGGIRMGQSNYGYLIVGLENTDTTRIENSYYATTNTSDFLLTPEIQSDIIDSKGIKLFVPIMEHEIRNLSQACDLKEYPRFKKLPDNERQQKRQEYLDCYQKKHIIRIDEKVIPTEFIKADHPVTQQFGIITYMNTADIKKGMHMLQIEKTLSDTKKLIWKIPFFIVETK
ncbi:hypothetical protein ACOKFD_16705 [Flagellimonas sp. S174]|uniref:hypothetical protein n=1 Tax=Flagellimonas sp. S174 TaxID=3410790 RepID=UPI003BF53E14